MRCWVGLRVGEGPVIHSCWRAFGVVSVVCQLHGRRTTPHQTDLNRPDLMGHRPLVRLDEPRTAVLGVSGTAGVELRRSPSTCANRAWVSWLIDGGGCDRRVSIWVRADGHRPV